MSHDNPMQDSLMQGLNDRTHCEAMPLSRRALLATSGALFAWAYAPRFAHAAGGRDARLVTIILRGALDGMSTVAPVGDPDYVGLRDSIALRLDGDIPALPLDGFFALHPAMPNFARLYKAGQATVVHAVASPYRERSHFDGQDVLESGHERVGRNDSGWMNRLLSEIPPGERIAPGKGSSGGSARGGSRGLGVGPTLPLIVRGSAPVLGWAPPLLPRADDDLKRRLLDLYSARDPLLARALADAIETERMATAQGMAAQGAGRQGPADPEGMKIAAQGAAKLMAAPDGPRIAALGFEGWDTHANAGGATGQLANRLGGLDASLALFETELARVWKDTAILVITEFGRTARINGTVGTDHGTATVALLVGGAVRGGRIIADWPGLKAADLHDGRDLKATIDLRAVIKGLSMDLFGLSGPTLSAQVFPGSDRVAPLRGLVT